MNLNLITYSIYLPIICFIMVKIGWLFYKNGEVFLISILNGNLELSKNINTLLLTGYYLLNIGYAILSIAYWENIATTIGIIDSLSQALGKIILVLAIMHFNNIFWLKYLTQTNILKQ